VKFKIDENLPSEVAELLRDEDHEATTVFDQQLGGAPDADIAATCQREQRALVTLDAGFGDIRSYPPEQFHGLIVLRLQRQDKPYLLEVFKRLIPILAAERLESRLWIVEEGRVRIRGS
jgi:predicted nuclease of predicted toxin-antitoxin system